MPERLSLPERSLGLLRCSVLQVTGPRKIVSTLSVFAHLATCLVIQLKRCLQPRGHGSGLIWKMLDR